MPQQKRTHAVNPPGTQSKWRLVYPEVARPTEVEATRESYELPSIWHQHEIRTIKDTLARVDLTDEQRIRLERFLSELEKVE